MTHDRDLERLLDSWLTDGPLVVADRVIDDVADRIGRQRQRPAWRLRTWRFSPMTSTLKLAASAAVLVVAVAGLAVLAIPRGGGPGAVAASPSLAPSPSAAIPSGYPISGLLEAGTHATRSFQPAFTFTVPEGWINDGDSPTAYTLFPDTPANRAEFARSGNTTKGINVASDLPRPYFICESWEDNRGATAAQMVAAVKANRALATSGLVDVTIGGLTGTQLDVGLNPTWTQTCPGDPPGTDLSQLRTRAIFLDRPGKPVFVILEPADLPEAGAIVGSIVFAR